MRKNSEDLHRVDMNDIEQIVRNIGTRSHNLIQILHEIQGKYRYLPKEAIKRVCEITDITPAQITGVSTFYSQFRHTPVGDHIIKLCFGTACYVAGAEHIYDALLKHLDIQEGFDTDPQRIFTVEKVACLGCCSLAPCMMIDKITYGHLSPLRIEDTIEQFLMEFQK